jgi:sec-independent protein translocase protein TatB
MFDFGFWEIAIIGIITLIVVGPEKMPELARKAGLYVGKFKKFVSKIQNDINNEIKSEVLKEQLSIKDEESSLSQTVEEAKSSIDEIKKEVAKISDLSSINKNS